MEVRGEVEIRKAEVENGEPGKAALRDLLFDSSRFFL
jgi:hypothetical protein